MGIKCTLWMLSLSLPSFCICSFYVEQLVVYIADSVVFVSFVTDTVSSLLGLLLFIIVFQELRNWFCCIKHHHIPLNKHYKFKIISQYYLYLSCAGKVSLNRCFLQAIHSLSLLLKKVNINIQSIFTWSFPPQPNPYSTSN